ncbi:MAG TPA: TetR/AcrR family transcriptional regulator, partial [Alphaproteobacteria bacterium]|nr:TetR/AcrR family transcriptional regulator [Alphaproteobacteria bacterium]
DAAQVSLTELYRQYPSKTALLAGFSRMIDEEVLAGGAPDEEDSPRDRLFDLLMRRFDALNAHRGGITRLLRDLRYDVPALAGHREPLERSMRWMLEAGGLSASGLVGALKVRALGLIYLLVLRIWADDDSEDMARTMAALDSRLRQAEQFANTFDPAARRRGAPSDGGADEGDLSAS